MTCVLVSLGRHASAQSTLHPVLRPDQHHGPLHQSPVFRPVTLHPPHTHTHTPQAATAGIRQVCPPTPRPLPATARSGDPARWALLGALGCVVPELLDGTNPVPWFKAGARSSPPTASKYLGVPGLINARSIIATLAVQVLLMGAVEGYRVNGGPAGEGLDPVYPASPSTPWAWPTTPTPLRS